MKLSRRTFLRGMGTAMALPFLEATLSRATLAADPGAGPDRRLCTAFVYVPNGAIMEEWTPAREGAEFELPPILAPLQALRREVLVLSGLAHRRADPNGDGPGDHARAAATFLTGCQARKTAAIDVRAGVSVDQVAAARVGRSTRLPSLELGCERGRQAGACDSGYSCAYQFNIAWKTPTLPLPPEIDPRQVFERLFGGGEPLESAAAKALRLERRRSILDFVLEDARRLRRRVGEADNRRLDDYFNAVRELESRLEKREAALPDDAAAPRRPESFPEHVDLMFELLVLAFRTDSTRVATFLLAHEGGNRSYPFLGVPDGHHDLSHHGGNREKKRKIARINRYHSEAFARFLDKLKAVREGDATLLDRSLIVYGSGVADGDQHTHHDLPVLLAGRGGGTVLPGRHVRYAKDTPMTNLYLALLERMGAPVASLGDSTGSLPGLDEPVMRL